MQEKTIFRDVSHIYTVIKKLPYPFEILIVVDGFLDNTYKEAKKIHAKNIKVVGYKHNHGKGYAVRFGMAKSKGERIAFLDAGMDLNPKGIMKMISIMDEKMADIVIGSKLHPNSHVTYPKPRRVLSWGYRTIVGLLFGLSIRDTQVGLKIYRRKVLEDVLPRLLVKKFAFDIEILAVANYVGYKKIVESPITLTFRNWSSITSRNFWKAVFPMLWDTCAIYYRLKILHYYSENSKRKWVYDPELNFKINLG